MTEHTNFIIIPGEDEIKSRGLNAEYNNFCRVLNLAQKYDVKLSLKTEITTVGNITKEHVLADEGDKLIIFHQKGANDKKKAINVLFDLMRREDTLNVVFIHAAGHQNIGEITSEGRRLLFPEHFRAFNQGLFNIANTIQFECFPFNGKDQATDYGKDVWKIFELLKENIFNGCNLQETLSKLKDDAKTYWNLRRMNESLDLYSPLYFLLRDKNIIYDKNLNSELHNNFAYKHEELERFSDNWTVRQFVDEYEKLSEEYSLQKFRNKLPLNS